MGQEFHILSLGAGRQSTALYLLSCHGGAHPFDAAIFADPGEEEAATYAHLDYLERHYASIIPILFESKGKLGDELVKGRNSTGQKFAAIPAYTKGVHDTKPSGMVRRQCTREYKTDVVERAIRRDVLGLKPGRRIPNEVIVHQYFGLGIDERGRAARVKQRVEVHSRYRAHFPLIDMDWGTKQCEEYNREHLPYPVVRSACVFCPFKSDREWKTLRETNPAGWNRAVEIDDALRSGVVANRNMDAQLFVHRSGVPLKEIADFDDRQGNFGFSQECEGMCGV